MKLSLKNPHWCMKNIIHLCIKAWVNTGLTQFGDEDTTFMTYIFFSNQAEKTSAMAASAIRNWWNTYQLKQSDTSDSDTEEDEEELAGRKLCKLFSHRLY